eukprot:82272-Hanusia_phi.AAC.2
MSPARPRWGTTTTPPRHQLLSPSPLLPALPRSCLPYSSLSSRQLLDQDGQHQRLLPRALSLRSWTHAGCHDRLLPPAGSSTRPQAPARHGSR